MDISQMAGKRSMSINHSAQKTLRTLVPLLMKDRIFFKITPNSCQINNGGIETVDFTLYINRFMGNCAA